MASSRVAIVFGVGPNVGAKVAQQLTTDGYKVAAVSRSGNGLDASSVALSIVADLTDPKTVRGVFEEVRTKLGEPNVVVYNASAFSYTQSDPLSVDLSTFQDHLAVNTSSAFAAIQEAVKSFDGFTKKATPCVFIYTGNCLNQGAVSPFLTLGTGKAATAHLVEYAAKTYAEKGYRFYYADERTAEGAPIGKDVQGDAHAEFYSGLVKKSGVNSYLQTFVKGQGYVKF
ncbi:hypothetical protein MMC07_002371 [Pseudocyphellaria aurata]|nr:hypothetical protein [Pseudocyphellaria aurata]